ncbi:hypothetical protein C8J57DRAFT_1520096 [Mycena rebaudengoi]|nr:hypothetical protein C8J57DRAFT_1520096 [Mycena rebaudengoi]
MAAIKALAGPAPHPGSIFHNVHWCIVNDIRTCGPASLTRSASAPKHEQGMRARHARTRHAVRSARHTREARAVRGRRQVQHGPPSSRRGIPEVRARVHCGVRERGGDG